MTHVRVWQFRPAPGREEAFAAAYSSDGMWAKLFRLAAGFTDTTLLAPIEHGGSWLTIDRWASQSDFELFQQEQGEAYRRLDAELEPLTSSETFIGAFDEFPA